MLCRTALTVLALCCLLCLVFAVGGAASGESTGDDAWLVATFGAGMGIFGLTLVDVVRRGGRAALTALAFLPVFFALHVVAFGTWLPDGLLAVLSFAAVVALSVPAWSPRRLVARTHES